MNLMMQAVIRCEHKGCDTMGTCGVALGAVPVDTFRKNAEALFRADGWRIGDNGEPHLCKMHRNAKQPAK